MLARSPEPCQVTGSTVTSASRGGQKARQAGLDLDLACQAGLGETWPAAGIAAKRAQQRLDKKQKRNHGRYRIARQPKKINAGPSLPKTIGLPGWISAPVKKNSAPRESRTSSTRSYLPMETPPESSTRSALEGAANDGFKMPSLIARNGEPHRLCSRGENLRRQ